MATRRASALNADAATKPGAAQSSRDGALKHSAYAVSNACSRTPASTSTTRPTRIHSGAAWFIFPTGCGTALHNFAMLCLFFVLYDNYNILNHTIPSYYTIPAILIYYAYTYS